MVVKNQKGIVMLELCVSLTIILTILLVVANFGLGFREWNLISFAAREGARYGSETGSAQDATYRAESLIKINKGTTTLGSQYSVSSNASSGRMCTTIKWERGGMAIESAKCFKIQN